MARRYPASLYVATLMALFGAYAFGYHLGVLNTCMKVLAAKFHMEEVVLAPMATSSMLVGAALGSMFAGQLADRVGPKYAMILNNFPLVVGAILCGACNNVVGLYVGRFIAGVGSGAASLFTPRYIAEISPPEVRGALGTLTQVFINVGILMAYLAGLPYEWQDTYLLTMLGYDMSWWRFMMYLALLPCALQLLTAPWSPESPVWLGWVGKHEAAGRSFRRLLRECVPNVGLADERPVMIEEEGKVGLMEEADGVLGQGEMGGTESEEGYDVIEGWSGLFKYRYRWIMAVAAVLPVAQQLSGINTVIFYSSEVFRSAGVGSPIVSTLVVGAVNLVFTVAAGGLMDRLGRKTLLLLSQGGMGACLLIMIGAMSVGGASQSAGAMTVMSILAYILCFALGVGPIPWLYIGEVMPDNIKGKAGALCTSLNWLTSLIVALTFPSMLRQLGIAGSYLVYCLFNMLACLYFNAFMVETRKQSLAQIKQLMLLKDKPRGVRPFFPREF